MVDLLKLPPLIFDIETDGLLDTISKIHCIVVGDQRFPPEKVGEAVALLQNHDGVIVGHNIVAFDIPAIQKFYPGFNPQHVLDTKVWAQLVCPDVFDLTMKTYSWKRATPPKLWNSQSLKAWGYRLGVLKGETPDSTWQTYSPEMLEYCAQDVVVTTALYEELLQWTTSPEAVKLEMDVARIIQRQHEYGVCFDREAAERLSARLVDEVGAILAELQRAFPPKQKLDRVFVAKVNNRKLGYIKGQTVRKYKTVEFNPNSGAQIAERLKDKYGWEPTVFTDKGNPQMDDDVLSDLAKTFPEVELIQKYQTANKILSFLVGGEKNWLGLIRDDGRIHGYVNSCGAGTRRMTHNTPNLGQVPSSRAYLGHECRSLFHPPEGYLQVGVDAEQLELRGLAHFLYRHDHGVYVHAAISGTKDDGTDIHSRNAKAIGVDRDLGKTVFYAYIYGAGLEKLGRIVTKSWDKKKNIVAGRKIKYRLEKNLPAIVKLKEEILSVVKSRGYLLDAQGQMFRLRSEHSCLNELNQRLGAIVMKVAQVECDRTLQERGLVPGKDYEFMLTVHDEWQFAVLPQHVDTVKTVAADSIAVAGVTLGLRCPLAGNGDVGNTWADTH
jgi:DNA polymerase I-like protein with 3'-5' exonuclease and polymerase domains